MASNLNLRRLRQSSLVRELARETRVSAEQLMQPLFTVQGLKQREPIPGMSGVYRENSASLLSQVEADLESGVKKFILFGVPGQKKTRGFDFNYTANEIAEIKKRFGKDLFLAVDVCLCSSTDHGQCGVVDPSGTRVLNSETVEWLSKAALAYAQAGADCVAPSDMMDGRVGEIRAVLDAAGLEQTLLMSYSAKFDSRFYGPFRVAADSAPKAGQDQVTLKDRSTYQIDPGRYGDALACSERDLREGADILMVKPGMPYLDVLYRLSQKLNTVPWAVYEVSGEYAAVEVMTQQGLINADAAHREAWTAFIRAGASLIITYGARYAKRILV